MIGELPVSLPPFFAEACGYRGSARYVAARWMEGTAELLLSDNGHVARGRAAAMTSLWRRNGGDAALEQFRAEALDSQAQRWLLFDRERRRVSVGSALGVWRIIETQHAR